MSKKNLEKKKVLENEGVWSIVLILLPIVFLIHYFIVAPWLSGNTGNNNDLIIVLSLILGMISTVLTIIALVTLKQKRKLLAIFGLITGVAFFLYTYVAATFVITF